MSDTPPPPPPPLQPIEPQPAFAGPPPTREPNRMGLVALIVGIVALVLAFVPFASYVAGLPAIVAIVLGIVAVARAGNRARGAGISGIVLGVVALIAAIVMSVVYTVIFVVAAVQQRVGSLPDGIPSDLSSLLPSDLPTDFPTDLPTGGALASAPTTGAGGSVVFAVTGSGSATAITYAALGGAQSGTDELSDQRLPWTKTVGIGTDGEFFTLIVQGSGSDPVTCTITVNGKRLSKQTSSGTDGIAACSGHTG